MATGIKDKVTIIGMGCTRFGERWDMGAEELMVEAFEECLADAGIEKKQIDAAWFGSCMEEVHVCKTAGAVYGAEQILSWGLDHCRRTNRGGRPLSKSRAVQFELVEMAADVKVGRTFMDKLVADHIEEKDIVVETAMAKFWTTDLANRAAP